MTEKLHTLTEGQRVHYLANLGGLLAIAGLDNVEPDLLLGVLTEIEQRLKQLSPDRIQGLREKGGAVLKARNAEKRSFKSWQTAQKTERFDLTETQMKQLILKMGGKLPALEKDIAAHLRHLIRTMT